jgi:hypothetical protein
MVDNRMNYDTLVLNDRKMSSYQLNRSYDFVTIYYMTEGEGLRKPHTSEIFVRCWSVTDIVRSFNFFTKKDLYVLCNFVELKVKYTAKSTIKSMMLSLLIASSSEQLNSKLPVLVFKERSHPRNLSQEDSLRLWTIETLQLQVEGSRKRRNKREAEWCQQRKVDMASICQQGRGLEQDIRLLEDTSNEFPYILSEERKRGFINKWQQYGPNAYREKACAVCGKGVCESQISVLHADTIDLTLLRNENVTSDPRLVPKGYNFRAYDRAILYHGGLITPGKRGYMQICEECRNCLMRKKQPLDSWANYQYYGLDCLPDEVATRLKMLSDFDKMMICRA